MTFFIKIPLSSVPLFVILPTDVTIFSCEKVFKKIREHNTDVSQGLQTPAVSTPLSSHEIRICRSLFVIVFGFVLCWLPAWLITILKRLHIAAKIPRNVEFVLLPEFVTYHQSFIYAGMNPLFRRAFRRIFFFTADRASQSMSLINNIGAIFESTMTMHPQVNSVCNSTFYHLRNISRIRKFLSLKTTKILVHDFVSSKLEHCHSLLYNVPKYVVTKLQSVQNAVARLITCSRKCHHNTPVLSLSRTPSHLPHYAWKLLTLIWSPMGLEPSLFLLLTFGTVNLTTSVH